MTYPIPKSRVKDPANRGTPRQCLSCGEMFCPHKKRNDAKCCSSYCVWKIHKGPEFNDAIAKKSAALRGDIQRGRGEGKTYRKLNGRHEHRVVAERKLGRALMRGEIVHHADETKINNLEQNLEILPSQAEHARIHFLGKKQTPEHIQKRIESKMHTMRLRRSGQ